MIAPSQFQSADLPVLASSAILPATEVRHTNGPLQNHVADQSNVADLVTKMEVTDVQVPNVLVQHDHQPSCVAMLAADASQSVASGDQFIMGDQDVVNITIPAAHTPQSAASIDEPNLNDQDEVSGSLTDSVNSEPLVDHIVDDQISESETKARSGSVYRKQELRK
ncbi:hypothetical protein V6N11_044951 [Hibiscus sabdariffa]|uniref:Uncharacterized protein n=1 Tax=Hibiscus sabdariffa TaxID=183260 RepID=A0ABR2PUX2_9ROSI